MRDDESRKESASRMKWVAKWQNSLPKIYVFLFVFLLSVEESFESILVVCVFDTIQSVLITSAICYAPTKTIQVVDMTIEKNFRQIDNLYRLVSTTERHLTHSLPSEWIFDDLRIKTRESFGKLELINFIQLNLHVSRLENVFIWVHSKAIK